MQEGLPNLTVKSGQDMVDAERGICQGDGWSVVNMAEGDFASAGSLLMAYRDPLPLLCAEYKRLYSDHGPSQSGAPWERSFIMYPEEDVATVRVSCHAPPSIICNAPSPARVADRPRR